jgi:hypothetical protein
VDLGKLYYGTLAGYHCKIEVKRPRGVAVALDSSVSYLADIQWASPGSQEFSQSYLIAVNRTYLFIKPENYLNGFEIATCKSRMCSIVRGSVRVICHYPTPLQLHRCTVLLCVP